MLVPTVQAEFLEMVNEPVEAGASAEMLAQLGYDEDMGEGERVPSIPNSNSDPL